MVQGLTLVAHAMPDGCCASYYPETQPLIALEHHDPQSFTPAYKSVPVKVGRAGPSHGGALQVGRSGVAGNSAADQ